MENSNSFEISRRDVLKSITGTVGALSVGGRLFAQPAPPKSVDIQIDVTRQHELSPYLFMQFMEPLGATDGSVEAGWDHRQKAWRADLIEATQQLAPPLLRWGGCFEPLDVWFVLQQIELPDKMYKVIEHRDRNYRDLRMGRIHIALLPDNKCTLRGSLIC